MLMLTQCVSGMLQLFPSSSSSVVVIVVFKDSSVKIQTSVLLLIYLFAQSLVPEARC